MTRCLTVLTLFITGFTSALCADDAYHTYIRSQLAEQFGLVGGAWLLPDSEAQTNASIKFDNVTVAVEPSSGIESFTQVMHITVPEQRINSWDNILRFTITSPIDKGDLLLLIFWIDTPDVTPSSHDIIFDFEFLHHPENRPLYLPHKIKPGWRQWFIPVRADQRCDAGAARFQIHLGHIQGSIRLAGVAMLNFANHYQPDDMPHSVHHLEYDGQEQHAEWRQIALDRIDHIRTSMLNLKIVNQFNEPIEGATITVTMLRHEFGFGSAVSSDLFFNDSHHARLYLQKLENLSGDGRSFNIVTLKNALKWPAWEDEIAWGSRERATGIVRWFVERGVRVRGHNLLWPSWDKMPADLHVRALDQQYITSRIQNHIFEQVAFPGLQGMISEWDVLNEIQSHDDLISTMGSSEIYADCFTWAAMADPQARLYLNEHHIIAGEDLDFRSLESLTAHLCNWRNAGVPIHGLGLQGHMTQHVTPPEKLLQIFDNFDQFDLDLSITEYDAVGVDDRIAADYMRDILIASFSHPKMRNFIMWGFWDGAHWKGDAPLFYHDWSLKPSGRVFLDYVFDTWWTTANGESDQHGLFSTYAFYGDYQIEASLDSHVTEHTINFSRHENNIILKIDTDQTTVHIPEAFQLEANSPNPFNSVTTLNYLLPTDKCITMTLYDCRGREIKTLLDQFQRAGRHTLEINGASLASGVYYVRLQSGRLQHVRKILLIK